MWKLYWKVKRNVNPLLCICFLMVCKAVFGFSNLSMLRALRARGSLSCKDEALLDTFHNNTSWARQKGNQHYSDGEGKKKRERAGKRRNRKGWLWWTWSKKGGGDIMSKGWRLGRRGRQTQVEHAAHIIALACVSHRYTAAGRGPVHCYQLV